MLTALRFFYDDFLEREAPFNIFLHRNYRQIESLLEAIWLNEIDHYYIPKGMPDES